MAELMAATAQRTKIENVQWRPKLYKNLWSLQNRQELCDFIVADENNFGIPVHSCVIAAASEKLADVINQVKATDTNVFMLEQVSVAAILSMVEFIYTGETTVDRTDIDNLHILAEELGVHDLSAAIAEPYKYASNIKSELSLIKSENSEQDVESTLQDMLATPAQPKMVIIEKDDKCCQTEDTLAMPNILTIEAPPAGIPPPESESVDTQTDITGELDDQEFEWNLCCDTGLMVKTLVVKDLESRQTQTVVRNYGTRQTQTDTVLPSVVCPKNVRLQLTRCEKETVPSDSNIKVEVKSSKDIKLVAKNETSNKLISKVKNIFFEKNTKKSPVSKPSVVSKLDVAKSPVPTSHKKSTKVKVEKKVEPVKSSSKSASPQKSTTPKSAGSKSAVSKSAGPKSSKFVKSTVVVSDDKIEDQNTPSRKSSRVRKVNTKYANEDVISDFEAKTEPVEAEDSDDSFEPEFEESKSEKKVLRSGAEIVKGQSTPTAKTRLASAAKQQSTHTPRLGRPPKHKTPEVSEKGDAGTPVNKTPTAKRGRPPKRKVPEVSEGETEALTDETKEQTSPSEKEVEKSVKPKAPEVLEEGEPAKKTKVPEKLGQPSKRKAPEVSEEDKEEEKEEEVPNKRVKIDNPQESEGVPEGGAVKTDNPQEPEDVPEGGAVNEMSLDAPAANSKGKKSSSQSYESLVKLEPDDKITQSKPPQIRKSKNQQESNKTKDTGFVKDVNPAENTPQMRNICASDGVNIEEGTASVNDNSKDDDNLSFELDMAELNPFSEADDSDLEGPILKLAKLSDGNISITQAAEEDDKGERSKHKPVILTCPDCKLDITGSKEYKRHRKEVHNVKDEDVFDCGECGAKCRRGVDLRRHAFQHSKTRLTCEFCHKDFKTDEYLRFHIKSNHKPPEYLCTECGFATGEKRRLKHHMIRSHGPNSARDHVCHKCDKKFKKLKTLLEHRCTSTSFECDQCEAVLSTFLKYRQHMAKEHLNEPDPFQCDQCDFSTWHYGSLQLHEDQHRSREKYYCPVCKKTFYQKSYLLFHVRKHGDKYTNMTEDDIEKDCVSHEPAIERKPKKYKHQLATPQDDAPNSVQTVKKELEATQKDSTFVEIFNDDGESTGALAELTKDLTGDVPEGTYFTLRTLEDGTIVMETHQPETGNEAVKPEPGAIVESNEPIATTSGMEGDISTADIVLGTEGGVQMENMLMEVEGGEGKKIVCVQVPKGLGEDTEEVIEECTRIYENMQKSQKVSNDFELEGEDSKEIDGSQRRFFKCKFCSKKFRYRNHLQRHEMSHTGEKPFQCSICKKRDHDISNLRKHLLTHSEAKFKCDKCQKPFRTEIGMFTHRKRGCDVVRRKYKKKNKTPNGKDPSSTSPEKSTDGQISDNQLGVGQLSDSQLGDNQLGDSQLGDSQMGSIETSEASQSPSEFNTGASGNILEQVESIGTNIAEPVQSAEVLQQVESVPFPIGTSIGTPIGSSIVESGDYGEHLLSENILVEGEPRDGEHLQIIIVKPEET